jgi:hypothetical protein
MEKNSKNLRDKASEKELEDTEDLYVKESTSDLIARVSNVLGNTSYLVIEKQIFISNEL